MTRRNGYTLMELIAVLAVLVAVAAISIPLIKPMLQSKHKEAAADVIRARFSKLKAKAMNDGRPYAFQFEENTGKFRCFPVNDNNDEDVAEEVGALDRGELPGEIKFENAGSSQDSSGKSGGNKIIFKCDGTSSDALITIGQGASSITLKLHGATGVVTVAEGKGR